MRRQATSILEVEQIQRVSGLLAAVASRPGKAIIVTTADGKSHVGKLLSHSSGSGFTKRKKEPCCYGSIELATNDGTTEINFLDIVSIAPR